MSLRARAALAFACALVLSSGARAQTRAFDVQRYRPTLDPSGFIGINGTTAPGPSVWHASLAFDYGYRLLLDESLSARPLVEHRVGADAIFQIGLGHRGAIAVDLPLVLSQQGGAYDDGGVMRSLHAATLGDPRVVARVRLAGEPTERQAERASGAGLALQLGGTFPVGIDRSFDGEEQLTLDAAVLGDFHVLGLGFGLMLGWRGRPHARVFEGERFDDVLRFGAAIRAPVTRIEGLEILTELEGETGFRGIATNPIEARAGVRYTRSFVTLSSGVGFGLSAGVGSPRSRAYLVATFTRPVLDRDGDGVPDAADECPLLAEDPDGFEDDDGCSDPDDDGDFVLDEDDRCPHEAPADDQDADGDGCIDAAAPEAAQFLLAVPRLEV